MAGNEPLELPVGLTEKQFMQSVARIEGRLAKMEADALGKFQKTNDSFGRTFKGVENAATGMSNATRASLQNTGYQIQDIIVQIQGGQGVVRAFSQQLPQLLGGMGLVGVGLGILAPLILGVGAALLGSGADAKTAEEQFKSLAQALSEVQRTSGDLGKTRIEMMGDYGPEMVDQARQLLQIQHEIAKVNLSRELQSAVDMIGSGAFDLSDGTAEEWEKLGAAAEEYHANMKAAAGDTYELGRISREFGAVTVSLGIGIAELQKFKDMFGSTYTEAGKLAGAMARLRDASGDRDIAGAAAALREELKSALGDMEGLSAEGAELVKQLLNVEDAALRAAAADMTASITPAANEAKRLADELARAVDNAMSLALQGIGDLRRAEIEWDFRKDPLGRAGALAREQFDSQTKLPADADPTVRNVVEAQRRAYVSNAVETERKRQALADFKKAEAEAAREAKKKDKGSSTRANAYEGALLTMQGNLSATTDQIAAYRNLSGSLSDVDKQMTIIAERQKLLTTAQKAGVAITPELVAQVDQLVGAYVEAADELDGLKDAAKKGEDALTSMFGSILDGSKSGKEAVADLVAQIVKVQGMKAIMSLPGLGGLSTTIGGLLSFDGGGYTGSGPRLGGLDGKGGKLAMIHPQETIIDHTKGQTLGGSSAVDLRISIDEEGQVNFRKLAQREAGAAVAANNRAISDQRYLGGGR